MMPRAFLDTPVALDTTVAIEGDDGHHFARVLRVKSGEQVAVASHGKGYLCEVVSVDAKQGTVQVRILSALPPHEPGVRLFLVQGMAKGDKIDSVLQHMTELGAAGFLVCAAKRSVVRLEGKKADGRLERWQKVIREAAGQSQRDVIPTVTYSASATATEQWLAAIRPDLVLFLDEDESTRGLRDALQAVAQAANTPAIVAVVGPEGGWDASERALWAGSFGAVSTTLGQRTLRTETAGLVAAAAVFHHFGELGG